MNRKRLSRFAALCFLLLASSLSEPRKDFAEQPRYKVLRVVDGDTVVLLMEGKQVKVRLIGVDTPETVHPSKPVQFYGKEASKFTGNLLLGESVYLEYEPGSSRRDKYGRTLAYLYRAPDGLFINLEIVRQGYGHAYTVYPFRYLDLFREYEKQAREAGRGLWAGASNQKQKQMKSEAPDQKESAPQPAVDEQEAAVYITASGKKYHRDRCRFLSKSKIPLALEVAKARGYAPCPVCSPPQ